jgi:peroxiredoxin
MKLFINIFLFFVSILITEAQVPEKAEDVSPILIGEKLPQAKLYNAKNEAIETTTIFNKPTVLVFYRGGWCPYCNVHLAELAKTEAEILKLGYQIVAVSPDDFQNREETLSGIKMNYQVFSDKNGDFIKSLGLAYKAPEKSKAYIAQKTKGTVTEILPVPTLLVVNATGEVLMEYINPNITKRVSGKLLLAILQNI